MFQGNAIQSCRAKRIRKNNNKHDKLKNAHQPENISISSIEQISKDKNLNRNTKMGIYKTTIRPIVTHAKETVKYIRRIITKYRQKNHNNFNEGKQRRKDQEQNEKKMKNKIKKWR